ncbi:MAG: arginine repressor [Propionibacteriaceae bacterium]|nr:arginine repressor [Propionibacteriaceae bacterium]
MALSRAARQAKIKELIGQNQIGSQAELSVLLAGEGVVVSQGTLSRDLLDIGAVRVRGAGGSLVYVRHDGAGDADARLAKLCVEAVTAAESSANIAVLRTPPGAGQYLAWAIDQAQPATIVGTIAGDDTVLVVSRDAVGGAAVAEWFLSMAASGVPEPAGVA